MDSLVARKSWSDVVSHPPADLAAAKAQLAAEGWCVAPGVLSHAAAAEALERLWAAARESERRGMPSFLPVLDPNASNVRVFYLMELDPIFRELIQHPAAVEMLRAVVGPQFLISNFTANIARAAPSRWRCTPTSRWWFQSPGCSPGR